MNCPKCGEHIPFYELKPNCRKCGVNIMYYTREKDLERDAKNAELDFAAARIVVAKVRAAFIGGALPIARLALLLLSVASFLIPVATLTFSLPVFEMKMTVSGLGAYSLYGDGYISDISDFVKSSFTGPIVTKALVLYGFLALAVLIAVVCLVLYLLSFININKISKAIGIISFIDAAVCAALQIASVIIAGGFDEAYFVAKAGFGGWISAVLFIAFGVVNILIAKSEITLRVHEYDFERREIRKKIKSGEISLDDLSLPVFETEKEKEERLAALEKALKDEEEGKLDE